MIVSSILCGLGLASHLCGYSKKLAACDKEEKYGAIGKLVVWILCSCSFYELFTEIIPLLWKEIKCGILL